MSEASGSTPSQASIPASDASGNSDGAPDGLERLCFKIHRKLGAPASVGLPVADHSKASTYLQRARDLLVNGAQISADARTALVCAGVACMRRVNADVETEDNANLLRTTGMLIFALLVLTEGLGCELEADRFHPPTAEEAMRTPPPPPRRVLRDDEQLIAAWQTSSLADAVLRRDDGAQEQQQHASSWSVAIRSDALVSRASLKEARYLHGDGAVPALQRLAVIFYRCSASAISDSVMGSARAPTGASDGRSFLTLDSVGVINSLNQAGGGDETLASLADAAESESGQAVRPLQSNAPPPLAFHRSARPQVLRDMILSFKLPQGLVGVRRTLLLSRETNALATKSYTDVLNSAHEAAMRGANWEWQSDPDQIHKMSAVLAGLAVILAKTQDNVRKGDAFAGRVGLPFVDCAPPPPGVLRLGLVSSTGDWVVYKTNSAGTPKIKCRSTGFEGFCECALLFAQSVRT